MCCQTTETPQVQPVSPTLAERVDCFLDLQSNILQDLSTDSDYTELCKGLKSALSKVQDDTLQASILNTLHEACSMLLGNYGAWARNNKDVDRGRNPFDFEISRLTYTDFEFFADIAKSVENPLLRARLADLAWSHKTFRCRELGLQAVSGYMQGAVKADVDCWKLWERCLNLCTWWLGDKQSKDIIEKHLIQKVLSSTVDENMHVFHVLRILRDRSLNAQKSVAVAEHLMRVAEELLQSDNTQRAEQMYIASEKWGTSNEHRNQAIRGQGECKLALSSARPDIFGKLSFMNDAVSTFSRIPKKDRTRGEKERLDMLQATLSQLGSDAAANMIVFEGHVSVPVPTETLAGMEGPDALHRLAEWHPWFSYNQVKALAQDSSEEAPIYNHMPKTVLSPDGTVEARTLGGGDKDYQLELRRCYRICVAMRNVQLQHLLGTIDRQSEMQWEDVLRDLCGHSAFVMDDCTETYAQALYRGLLGDYRLATFLLVPLLEHILRGHLKNMGCSSSSRLGDGTDKSPTLNKVVKSLDGKFPSDFLFETGMLISEPAPKGMNIRNRWAHGLLCVDNAEYDDEFFAVWWLGLKAALECS